MTENRDEREWAEQLEAGRDDDALLTLAAELTRMGQQTQAAPSLAFQRQLRHNLLNQYDHPPRWTVSALWHRALSVGALVVLLAAAGLTWLSISSSGRPVPGSQPPAAVQSLESPEQMAVTESDTGQSPSEVIRLVASSVAAPNEIVPGSTLELTVRWDVSEEHAGVSAFAHLRNADGVTVAQVDGPHVAGETRLALLLPAQLPAGAYIIATGLYDQMGKRLPIVDQGGGSDVHYEVEVGTVIVNSDTVATATPAVSQTAPSLSVLEVTPLPGTSLNGTQPITFTVTLAYEAVALPALLEVRIAEGSEAAGRGVAKEQVDLETLSGEVTVPVVLHPAQELNGPADLRLWLQIKPSASAPPVRIEVPEAYRWSYAP